MKRAVSILIIMAFSKFCYAENMPTMSCLFEKFVGVNHEQPEKTNRHDIHQVMKIIKGITDKETLALDGKLRATNSKQWKNVTPEGWDTWETSFFGDFGEVLHLAHELGANKKPLHGWYKASMVSGSIDGTSIFLGNCIVE